MKKIKISIIVPVFNTKKYLPQCINSIINQSFKNIEIILVDDGSTDDSLEICHKYAKIDKRIKLIHKKNGGLSDARNVGIQNATGNYILFIDSDDFIAENSLESIYKLLIRHQKIDVIFLEAFKYFEENEKIISLGDGYERENIINKDKESVITYLASLPKYPASACTKLIRKELITDNNLYFLKGIFNEDIDWTIRLLLAANTYDYCEKPYYYYRQEREGSITNTYSLEKFNDLLNVVKKYASIKLNDTKYPFRKEIFSFMAYEYSILIMYYSKIKNNKKKELEKEIKAYSWLMEYRNDDKIRLIRNTYRLLGLNLTSKLLSIYYTVRTKIMLIKG